jgi:hypothetical protein
MIRAGRSSNTGQRGSGTHWIAGKVEVQRHLLEKS